MEFPRLFQVFHIPVLLTVQNTHKTQAKEDGNHTSDAGVEGDADAAVGIEGDGGHLAGAARPVLVVAVVAGHRVVVVVVNIRTRQRILITK